MKNRLDTWISKVVSGKEKDVQPAVPVVQNNNFEKTSPPPAPEKPAERNFSPSQKHSNHHSNHHPNRQKFRNQNHPAQGRPHAVVEAPKPSKFSGPRVRAIPLGGLNEVGRNSMCLEYGDDIIIIDAGIQFPESDMYGVKYVLPDTRYVEQKKKNIKAIIITHAHLDHIGGLAFLLPRLDFPPVYAPPLALGLIERQLKEHSGMDRVKLHRVNTEQDVLRFGAFTVEYFHVNHSIPDANGLYIQAPGAKIVHTGDFKFDFSPADGMPADFGKITKVGARGVDVIFADSTNAQREGFCISEKVVANTLERIISDTKKGRLFITSFSSVLARWQQIIRFAQKYNRKIYVTGRSLLENLRIASDMGYIRVPHGIIHKVTKRMHETPAHEQLIITTGAQGEENAALSRIARGEHDLIQVEKNDTVVFSSSAIPGNERQLTTVINALYHIGAKVITKNQLDVHTSGHAYQGDLKLMYALLKPKNIVPVHGEYHMRVDHARMVQEDLGYDEKNLAVISNGDILEIQNGQMHLSHEKAPGDYVFVDGKMIGDVGPEVQAERKEMMNGGVVTFTFTIDRQKKTLKNPPIVQSLGFAYPHESRQLHLKLQQEAHSIAQQSISRHGDPKEKEVAIRRDLEERLAGKIMELTERAPRILITLLSE